MTETFSEIPGWTFDVREVSAGVYRVLAVDEIGRRIEETAEDPEQALERCKQVALGYGREEGPHMPLPYFAYGSNLCPDQMAARCPGSRLVGVAWLADYALCFPRTAVSRADMGVAGIRPEAGAEVWGVVYTLGESDWAALDVCEEVAAGSYYHAQVTVAMADGTAVDCRTYMANPRDPADPARHYPPSAAYIGTILAGAEAQGLPTDYIAQLSSFRLRHT